MPPDDGGKGVWMAEFILIDTLFYEQILETYIRDILPQLHAYDLISSC